MPKQQRTMRIEQKGQLADMQALETKSDEELAAETRYKAMAQAILGARAAERYDAPKARAHFQKALAAARPQERMQLRRMADASLALAERRAGDLKTATERLGVEAPSGRQLFAIRMLGIVAPPKSDGIARRIVGILIAIAFVVGVFAIGFGIIYGIGQAAGGISVDLSIFYGFLLVIVVAGVLFYLGRRRQRNAKAKRDEQLNSRAGAK
jgi:hypothetical protein